MTQKEVVKEMLEKNKKNLIELKIDERYFQRKNLTDTRFTAKLGAMQGDIKLQEDYIKFLEEIEKE